MKQKEQPIGVWQYFMLVLSIVALGLLAVQSFLPLAPNTRSTLRIVDTFVCIVFFADFAWQLIRSRPRMAYLKWGWLDLISSIPMLPAFRVARLARVARIIRVLRGARASRHMLGLILLHRARSTFGAVVFGSFVLLLFSAIAIVNVEPSLTPRDAFWWCLFTLITGEYGDFYPASTEGRVITALLMTAGVAIFGTFTASVASFFLEEEQEQDERRDTAILAEIGKLTREISELKQQIGGDPDGKHPEEGS
jgi:voltage-gated potassium channel